MSLLVHIPKLMGKSTFVLSMLKIFLQSTEWKHKYYFAWFSLDQTQIYKIICPMSRKKKRCWSPSISPRWKFFCVCLLLLPYKLRAEHSKVTPVEKGDKDKWIQTSCYTCFLTWFKSCNGAGEVPEWIRLEFQIIPYLSHHWHFPPPGSKMHWF